MHCPASGVLCAVCTVLTVYNRAKAMYMTQATGAGLHIHNEVIMPQRRGVSPVCAHRSSDGALLWWWRRLHQRLELGIRARGARRRRAGLTAGGAPGVAVVPTATLAQHQESICHLLKHQLRRAQNSKTHPIIRRETQTPGSMTLTQKEHMPFVPATHPCAVSKRRAQSYACCPPATLVLAPIVSRSPTLAYSQSKAPVACRRASSARWLPLPSGPAPAAHPRPRNRLNSRKWARHPARMGPGRRRTD